MAGTTDASPPHPAQHHRALLQQAQAVPRNCYAIRQKPPQLSSRGQNCSYSHLDQGVMSLRPIARQRAQDHGVNTDRSCRPGSMSTSATRTMTRYLGSHDRHRCQSARSAGDHRLRYKAIDLARRPKRACKGEFRPKRTALAPKEGFK